MIVEVYKNLHKNCWSVRDNKTGRVIDHVRNIYIKDATLVVRPSGRKKVLRERRKNVHAFIKGTINKDTYMGSIEEIIYNPYKYSSFVIESTEIPIYNSNHVYLDTNGKVYAEVDKTLRLAP